MLFRGATTQKQWVGPAARLPDMHFIACSKLGVFKTVPKRLSHSGGARALLLFKRHRALGGGASGAPLLGFNLQKVW